MTTLVDVTAVPPDRRGVGRYIDELVRAFNTEVVIACQAHDEQLYRALAPTARVLPQRRITRVWARLLWEQFVLPAVARRAGVRVIHSPHYTVPLFTRRARVVTFHDATFFSDPEVHTRVKRVFFRTWIRLSSRLATRVIVPSRATATELARYVGEPRVPYRVVYHGVDHEVFRPPTPAQIADAATALGLTGAPWIAFLGTLEPRKNLPALLDAYALLATTWEALAGPVPTLAIAGGAGWGPDLDPAMSAVPAPGRVAKLGYVDLARVPALLGGALIVTYPSLGEGFGLPVLEAMACGAPVLTTPRLALPEVGGDAVAYSEPDATSLATALHRLATDPVERNRLSSAGLVRSAEFTWQACASEHLAVYAEAAGAAV